MKQRIFKKQKKQQISFTLRYYYNGAIKESFLHFESAERLDAAGLTGKIVHLLERYGLNYKNNLVGQAYDGAAVMSGKHSGVQTKEARSGNKLTGNKTGRERILRKEHYITCTFFNSDFK